MLEQLAAAWPDAPAPQADPDGRWLRFRFGPGRVVYLQRFAWDDVTRPDYVVAWHEGDEQAEQQRFGDFAGAAAQVRRLAARAAVTSHALTAPAPVASTGTGGVSAAGSQGELTHAGDGMTESSRWAPAVG